MSPCPPGHCDLTATVSGGGRFPRLTLETWFGVSCDLALDDLLPLGGGHLASVDLAGARLGELDRAQRHQLLRCCRRLLRPGGKLRLPVGPRPDQYPRAELESAAWLCGFEAWIGFAAGAAVLAKPRHQVARPPLVSILIPAYKSRWFAAALQSALDQTHPHCEILVCDDSPDGTVAGIIDRLCGGRRDHPVRLVRNPGNIGGRRNYLQCFDLARGDYVKFLNDDDVLDPDCCRLMADCLDAFPAATLVTSTRRLIDAEDRELPDEVINRPLLERDGLLDGRALATQVLGSQVNVIGEPSTVMFRKRDLVDNRPHLMSYAGRSARRNGDLSIWTTLLSRGEAIYLTRPLSRFRRHEDQVQRDPVFVSEARRAWVDLVTDARDTGLVAPSYLNRLLATPVDPLVADPDEGTELYGAGDLAAATGRFRARLARRPEDAAARSDLACVLWDAGRRDEALLEAALAACAPVPPTVCVLNLQDMLKAQDRPGQAEAVRERLGRGEPAANV